jgi:hypothetical protein
LTFRDRQVDTAQCMHGRVPLSIDLAKVDEAKYREILA